MDMNLMLIIVQENDAESLASAFKRSQIQATGPPEMALERAIKVPQTVSQE